MLNFSLLTTNLDVYFVCILKNDNKLFVFILTNLINDTFSSYFIVIINWVATIKSFQYLNFWRLLQFEAVLLQT
ncbi:hypothetical protein BpHYR1_040481 [Brachionus plicatilis]|uniref:Uncharacterized protein n=1 Tax=Brachionus plicatilis TaxID=10195 RepID=A0A3M7T356_BRAPC|nr:hypothetical protein BpHYR1_040481 [Brachionus plicatilis]